MSRYDTLCHVISRYVTLCHAMPQLGTGTQKPNSPEGQKVKQMEDGDKKQKLEGTKETEPETLNVKKESLTDPPWQNETSTQN